MKEKIKCIDYIKAFACLLVVIGHLLQSFQKSNIDPYTDITSFIIWFIYLFHMPLFMCMSGYLYLKNTEIKDFKDYKRFIFKKSINLLTPYLVFYFLYLAINYFFAASVNSPKGINELKGMINNPMSPYWFLYALLSIFLFIPILEKKINSKKILFSLLVILKFISFGFRTNIYILDAFMKNAVYFYFAIFLNENNTLNYYKKILLIVMYVNCTIFFYILKEEFNDVLNSLIVFLFAIGGIYIIYHIFEKIKKSIILDSFIRYTFQIYLMHTIFAAGIRIFLFRIGITNYYIHLILGVVFSIYVPVIVSKISAKLIFTDIVFYPLKTIKKIKELRYENFISK